MSQGLKIFVNNILGTLRPKRKALKRHLDRHIQKWRAAYTRKNSGATFIGITGSSGKSTTTALISHILSGVAPVHTQILTNVTRAHVRSLQRAVPSGYFIGEIAADGPGSLQSTIDVIKPSIGIVTLVALEHKSAFRKVEAVAEEKGKLVEALPANGLGILNCDDPRVAAMAERTKARCVTFGQTGGDYIVSNVHCQAPGELVFTVTHRGQAFEIASRLTGTHQSLMVAAAFACAHQLGVSPAVIIERVASFAPLFGRCSVYRAPNGPVFIVDTAKAPYHSLQLALDMIAGFKAPRKRIVIGRISDARSDPTYRRAYQATRAVADQVIFVGENSHRAKATAEEIADGRFVRVETVKEAAEFLRKSAIADELILLKSGQSLHLERLMLTFFSPVHCWNDVCGKKGSCVALAGGGCGLYGVPFEQHRAVRKLSTIPTTFSDWEWIDQPSRPIR